MQLQNSATLHLHLWDNFCNTLFTVLLKLCVASVSPVPLSKILLAHQMSSPVFWLHSLLRLAAAREFFILNKMAVSFLTSSSHPLFCFPAGILPKGLASAVRFGTLLSNILATCPVHFLYITRWMSLYRMYNCRRHYLVSYPGYYHHHHYHNRYNSCNPHKSSSRFSSVSPS